MSAIIKGETGDWEMVIGLEIHAQVLTNSKLFSGASASFGAAPNAQVSPVDAGMPGMLPVIDRFACNACLLAGHRFFCDGKTGMAFEYSA